MSSRGVAVCSSLLWLKQELAVVVVKAAPGLKLDSGKTDNSTIAEGHKTYSAAEV